jgi:hypothetical protein
MEQLTGPVEQTPIRSPLSLRARIAVSFTGWLLSAALIYYFLPLLPSGCAGSPKFKPAKQPPEAPSISTLSVAPTAAVSTASTGAQALHSPPSSAAPLGPDREALESTVRKLSIELEALKAQREAAARLDALRAARSNKNTRDAQVVLFSKLSHNDLAQEIDSAVDEAAAYVGSGSFSQQRHSELHERVNALWSVEGLTGPQNRGLGQACKSLNDIAVDQAVLASNEGRTSIVFQVVDLLGQWAFRLTPEQKASLIGALEAVTSTSAGPTPSALPAEGNP